MGYLTPTLVRWPDSPLIPNSITSICIHNNRNESMTRRRTCCVDHKSDSLDDVDAIGLVINTNASTCCVLYNKSTALVTFIDI